MSEIRIGYLGLDVLREHDIGVVVADTAGKWPLIEDATSDFVYVGLHGTRGFT